MIEKPVCIMHVVQWDGTLARWKKKVYYMSKKNNLVLEHINIYIHTHIIYVIYIIYIYFLLTGSGK